LPPQAKRTERTQSSIQRIELKQGVTTENSMKLN